MKFPTKKYGAILADPPWDFKTGHTNKGTRSFRKHYDPMTLDQLSKLPVLDLSSDDCCMFMWCNSTMLETGITLMRAWGFKYKSIGFVWVKRTSTGKHYHLGLGFWTRANPEFCLFGTKGHPKRLSKGVRQLIVSPVREHSRKPDEVNQSIRELVRGPYLELFARESKPGWDVWGNETNKFGGTNAKG